MQQLSWPRALRVLALTAVDLAAVASLMALFTDATPWSVLATIVVVVHLVSELLRLLRVPTFVSTATTLVLSVVLVARDLFPLTLRAGLPSGATLEAARTALVEARTTYGSVVAPVAPVAGFVLLAAAATWIVASTSDLVAFPGAARLEALVPGAAMVLFSAALGPDDRPGGRLLLFAGAAALSVAAGRLEELRAEPWLDQPDRPSQARSVLAAAAALCVVVTAVGVGRSAAQERVGSGVVDWRSGRDDAAARRRADTDPMVTVRSRLVDQSSREMFTAATVVGGSGFDLWRQRTLERFDGVGWTAASTPDPAATRGGEQTAEVRITVGALRGSAIPIPGYVLAVLDGDGSDTNLAGVDLRSEDAVAPNGLRDGDAWRVRWAPRPSLAALGSTRRPDLFSMSNADIDRLTRVPLPAGDRDVLLRLARQVTDGARDPSTRPGC